MKQTALVETEYFGCVQYISVFTRYAAVQIEQFENWQKSSFRNRTVLIGSNGLINLSVPILNGREQHQPVKNIKINNSDNWQAHHWRTIFSCYGKAPFFEFYKDELYAILCTKRHGFLFDLNMEILNWLLTKLKIFPSVNLTGQYLVQTGTGTDDLRNKWLPKNYQSGISGVEMQYTQVFQGKVGFQQNVSILDLLFCEGPAAKSFL
jgi:WbqC-like protein family.